MASTFMARRDLFQLAELAKCGRRYADDANNAATRCESREDAGLNVHGDQILVGAKIGTSWKRSVLTVTQPHRVCSVSASVYQ